MSGSVPRRDGALPPVVFLHGAGANPGMWAGCRSDSYRSIAPDLPGHGRRASERFAWDDAVADVVDLVRSLDRPPVVVGLSLGGYVAIGVAAKTPVSGLVISGATAQYLGFGGLTTRLSGLAMRFVGRRMRAKSEDAIRSVAAAPIAEEIIDRGLSMRGAADALIDLPGRDFHAMLESVVAPVLILNGERDATNRAEEDAALGRCSDGRIEIVEDAGHSCAISRPDAFRSHVEAFVDTVEAIDWSG